MQGIPDTPVYAIALGRKTRREWRIFRSPGHARKKNGARRAPLSASPAEAQAATGVTASASAIRSTAFRMFSIEVAKEIRR